MGRMERFLIYTDGAARGNPGPAGIGAVAYDGSGRELFRIAEFLGVATNNVAEYQAVARALEVLKRRVGNKRLREAEVEVRLDSELVARQLNGVYLVREEHLWPLFMRIHNLRVSTFPHIRFVAIPREENPVADALANEAIDRAQRG